MAITKCLIGVPPVNRFTVAAKELSQCGLRVDDGMVRPIGRFSQRRTSMAKSSVSDMTTKRPKEPFDPALDAPVALTPDQLEKVVGGMASLWLASRTGGTTFGMAPPPFPTLPSLGP